nr:hypothetical protein GCM10020092_072300 [Actinoplanes digitatis]
MNAIQYRVDATDTGHVNLDLISVRQPGERITLFDGHGLDDWQHTDGRRPQWPPVEDAAIEVCCGDLRTKEAFRDYRLHVEFKVPLLPPEVTGQNRGNSGVYQQERYEIQILDSYGDPTLDTNEARRDLPAQGAGRERVHRAGDVADLRHHVPRGPLRRGR